jgi:hypothetical protein
VKARELICHFEACLGEELRSALRNRDDDPDVAAEHKARAGTLRRRINLMVLELASKKEEQ